MLPHIWLNIRGFPHILESICTRSFLHFLIQAETFRDFFYQCNRTFSLWFSRCITSQAAVSVEMVLKHDQTISCESHQDCLSFFLKHDFLLTTCLRNHTKLLGEQLGFKQVLLKAEFLTLLTVHYKSKQSICKIHVYTVGTVYNFVFVPWKHILYVCW